MDPGSPRPSRRDGSSPSTETATATPATAAQPAVERQAQSPLALDADRSLVEVVDAQGLPVDHVRSEQLATHVLTTLDVPAQLQLSITYVDLERMSQLNAEHLGGSGPTDVLAFPIDAPDQAVDGVPGLLGDVVLCPAVVESQAPAHQRTISAETDLLLVHGILHLLGHDHAEAHERERMFALTEALLTTFLHRPGAAPDGTGSGAAGTLP